MRCLIFDLDGTLVDSEPLASQAFIDLLPELDDSAVQLMLRYRGRRLADVFADLAWRIGRPLPADFEVRYRDQVAMLYDRHLRPMPGVPQMLAGLRVPCCVASNGPRAKMHHGLKVTGLAAFFGANVFSSYDVGHWKPEPHLFLHAAERMQVAPDECVVIEDSESGLLAAAAAGMRAVHYRQEGQQPLDLAAASIAHFGELQAALESIG